MKRNQKGAAVPTQPTKGTRQFNVELPSDLVDEFRRFAEGRGESVSQHTARALRRHMDSPPPLPPSDPPLPPTGPVPPVEKKVGVKKVGAKKAK